MPRPLPESALDGLRLRLDHLPDEGPFVFTIDLQAGWFQRAMAETDAQPRPLGATAVAGQGGDPGSALAPETPVGRAELELSRQGDGTTLLRGGLELAFSVPCARCLVDASVDAGGEVVGTFVPAARLRELRSQMGLDPDEELELESAELDQIAYEGEELDLSDYFGQLAGLAYPMRALCKRGEACLGLCSGCGADRNLQDPERATCAQCQHPHADREQPHSESEEVDTPWKRALKGLKPS